MNQCLFYGYKVLTHTDETSVLNLAIATVIAKKVNITKRTVFKRHSFSLFSIRDLKVDEGIYQI